jgi:CHASE3 domain sensor protein
MGADDNRRLEEIRNERIHRLRLLEKRQAIEGFRTPPEVFAEIEQTRRELGMVEDAMTHPASVDTAEAMGAGARWLATDRKLDLVVKMLSERMDRMEEHADERHETQERARESGQAFYRLALAILAGGVLLCLILIAAIIGGRFL